MSYSRLKILPKPQGPFPTGCIDFMHGRSKEGTLLRLFYPTQKDQITEEHLTPWFPGYEYTKGLSRFLSSSLPRLCESMLNWSTKDAQIPSHYGAPLAQGKFPLIVFSHGLIGHRIMYSTICNDLASHGFVVAALEHRYDTQLKDESACATFTLSDSGEKVYIEYKTPEKNKKEYPLRHEQVEIRAKECIAALNVLENLANGSIEDNDLPSPLPVKDFEGKIDTSQPILAGHSFGAAATILALSKDTRFKVGLALDPWMFPLKEDLESLSASIQQPILFILTEAFQNNVNFKAFLPFNHERNRFVTLKGSVHQNQSDMPFLFGFVGRMLGGAWSSLDRHLAISLNNKLMINFICSHLGFEVESYDSFLESHSGDLMEGLLELAKFRFGWESLEKSF
ncbi:Platelet-activating factor acetylhydrolase [Armadillidium vulgare]|nr:Platelet-activating factor acetylhydrolase [Armadillidium vulgare]